MHITSSYNRIHSLDLIRGVAILGILIMNIFSMAAPEIAYSTDLWSHTSDLGDTIVYIVQSLLVETRFMTMFAILFGVGLTLQRVRLEERGENYRGKLNRRLLWLLVFGLLHGYLLWTGDILTVYALGGLLALGALRWKPKRLIIVGIVLVLLGQILELLGLWGSLATGENYFAVPPLPMDAEAINLQREVWTTLPSRLTTMFFERSFLLLAALVTYLPHTIGLMFIGSALYQMKFFENTRAWRWGIVFFLLGLLGGVAVLLLRYAVSLNTSAGQALMGLMRIPGIFSGIAYISFMVPFAHSQGLLARSLRNTGKTAFTLYIAQTVVSILLFVVILRPMWGTWNRPELLLYVLVFSIVQVIFAHYWQTKHGQGPLESFWRRLSGSAPKSK